MSFSFRKVELGNESDIDLAASFFGRESVMEGLHYGYLYLVGLENGQALCAATSDPNFDDFGIEVGEYEHQGVYIKAIIELERLGKEAGLPSISCCDGGPEDIPEFISALYERGFRGSCSKMTKALEEVELV